VSSFRHSLLVHPRTLDQVDNFLNQPAHALLLVGVSGSGKYALAKALAANLLGLESTDKLASYPYFVELSAPDGKQEIPIDAVRGVIHNLRLKTPGRAGIQRIIVIDGAQNLSGEAQNALLKTLEEPAADTVFILTAPSSRVVAPTIASRAQTIAVYPVTRPAALAYYQNNRREVDIASNWLLSAGAAGLLDSLLDDKASHPLKDAVISFKTFLGSSAYERLLYCDGLSKDKAGLGHFLDGGKRVLRALHQNAVKNGNAKQSKILAKNRKFIGLLQTRLAANASPRLIALSLALNLNL